ncbi:MAG: methyltransferase domain-containing protein [Phycisphaerales bacterium]|jgi:hypothetical protein|nr:methyltransferase domain-containing protein [Phycisphaerales bacterium]
MPTATPPVRSPEELARLVAELAPWQYRFELAPGVETMPVCPSHEYQLGRRRLLFGALDGLVGPRGYAGLSCLDIACNAGAWSLELHARGATDIDAFDARPENVRKAELVREVKGVPASHIRYRVGNVYDLSKDYQPHDLCLALGVFYHLANPMELARQLFESTTWLAVVDSDVIPEPGNFLRYMREDATRQHNGVEDIILKPTAAALVQMLHDAGFGSVSRVTIPSWAPDRYKKGERVLLIATREGARDVAGASF